MSPRDKDRWRITGSTVGKAAATGGGIIIITIGALIATVGQHSTLPGTGTNSGRLELIAARDLGALPTRDSWCTLGRAAEHCYDLQESTGNATDLGTGSWHLTPTGMRRAVTSSVLTKDSTGWVDYQSELATWGDGQSTSGLAKASAVPSATDIVSVTLVTHPQEDGVLGAFVGHRDASPPQVGWYLFLQANGSLSGTIDYGAGVVSVSGSTDLRGAWHCATVVLNAQTANAGRVYVNGVDDTVGTGDLSVASGGFTTTAPFRIHGLFDAPTWASRHGISRLRHEEGHATTLAEHQELCGDLWQAPAGGIDDNKPLSTDATWIQTGGPKCYPSGASTAVCAPGGLEPYVVDATGLAWQTEPDAVNRILYNTYIDCTNWVCRGTAAATPMEVAPDGSATASEISVGTLGGPDDLYQWVSGYTADASLIMRMWTKCDSGTLVVRSHANANLGNWNVDCSCVAGAWTLLTSSHNCVTETYPWKVNVAGQAGPKLHASSGTVTATIWGPTLTEEAGSGVMVIPTLASASSTGDPAWVITNTGGKYWQSGDTVLQSLTQISGTCWTADATEIRLSGASGSECTGAWYGIQVTP